MKVLVTYISHICSDLLIAPAVPTNIKIHPKVVLQHLFIFQHLFLYGELATTNPCGPVYWRIELLPVDGVVSQNKLVPLIMNSRELVCYLIF